MEDVSQKIGIMAYALGIVATLNVLVPPMYRRHCWPMVIVAVILSIVWPVMAYDIITGEIGRED